MLNEELNRLAGAWWVLVVYGVIAVLFGVLAITQPLGAAIGLAWAMGVMALVEGGASVIALFDRNAYISRGWLVLYALASLLFGVVAIINPLAVASILLIILAVWLVLAGVFRIMLAIRIRKHVEGEWLIALSGVLSLVLGVLFILSPLQGLVVTTLWIGVLALLYGAVQIFAGWRLRKWA